jgi:hypothetical protein
MSQVAHLKKLLGIHQRNLEILKERAALQSVDVPVSVVNQINGEEEAIEDIKTQLANLGVAPEEAAASETPAAGGASPASPPDSGGGGISIQAGGDVTIDGALFGRDAENVQLNITKTENPDLAQIAELFTQLYQDIDKSAVPLKEPVKDLTQQLEEEVTQPDSKPDETKVEGLLKAIRAMAPDIFEVAITTFANPAAGAAMVISKIGERIKAEAGS